MYLRYTTRRKAGKVHRYWTLVRSVRVGRRVIQQTVAHLGELDEKDRLEARALARHLIGAPEQAQLFDDGSRDVAVPVRLKGIQSNARDNPAMFIWRLPCGVARAWRSCASACCRPARSMSPGRRWWPCWWRRDCADHRASCISPKIGIGAPRSAISCGSLRNRSTKIAFIARSISSWCISRRSKHICPSAAASCFRSTTKCCSMT